MKTKLLVLLPMVVFLTSCACVGTQAKLTLPPELVVPKISLGEVKGKIPDEVIERIKLRDQKKSARIETLKSIIKTTH